VAERPVTRVVVVADTHLRTGPPERWLPPAADEVLAGCDVVLHAGDVLDAPVLERLADVAAAGGRRPPVHAVLGNNDHGLTRLLPETLVLHLDGVTVGMVHDSGRTAGRAARMRRLFPTADVVVFGHSHAPVDEEGDGGQRLFNPGSPTQRRAQPRHTLGELVLAEGRVQAHRIIPLD
jgi:putative phosphoesterase